MCQQVVATPFPWSRMPFEKASTPESNRQFFFGSALLVSLCLAAGELNAAESDLALELKAFDLPRQGVARIVKDGGPGGGDALLVQAERPNWAGTLTRIFSLPPESVAVDLRGEMKVTDVAGGGQSFTKARALVNFLDEKGDLVGGWQASTDRDGTGDWESFSKSYPRPAGAQYAKLELGLYNAVGEVRYADVHLTARDENGRELQLGPPPPAEVRTDTSGWRVFDPGDEDVSLETIVDVPQILGISEAAGARGFVTVKGDSFAFEDGTPVRFWATNIGNSRNWPTKEVGVALVERLRRHGFNLVRLHHLDAGWAPENIFASNRLSTRALDPDRLDRLQAQLARFREAGIYYWADLLVTRKFTEADGVRDADELGYGAKLAGFFNRRLIELQKEYARQLLTTPNPYTGLSMAQDPALAFVGLFNESSLFMNGPLGSFSQLPASYIEEINALYARWRADAGLPPETRDVPALARAHDEVLARFLMETQDAYYDEMCSFLRDDLGVKVPIFGSNYQETVGDVLSNARLDAYDVHSYWDHPNGGWEPTDQTQNQRLVPALRTNGAVFLPMARQSMKGLPFFISEWQSCWPNETNFEGPLLYSTMAALQGWDGLANFSFESEKWGDLMTGVYEAGNKPSLAQAIALSALLYRRGDVPTLPPAEYPLGDKLASGPTPSLPVSTLFKNSVQVVPGRAETEAHEAEAPSGSLRTPGGSVSIDERNLFRLNVPRAAVVLGDMGGQAAEVGLFRFETSTPYVQLAAVSLDDQPLATSRRILVQALGRAENTDMVYRAFRRGVSAIGTAPILLEEVTGSVSWKPPQGSNLKLTQLDWHGRRTASSTPLQTDAAGRVTIPFSSLMTGQALVETVP